MPRSGKKGGGKNTSGHRASDVTLDDFANCKVFAGRLRKSTSNSFVREAKNCSSFEEVIRSQEDEVDADEDGTQDLGVQNRTKLKVKCRNLGDGEDQLSSMGQDYPLDLWFLLSEYISPEDVHIFASLCKSALYVVRTYKFWISLYRRYYTLSAPLPDNLLPQNIQRPRFLRLSVIRALHYLYPPFAKRVSVNRWVDHQAYQLRQLCCTAIWHSHADSKFTFFFKFCASKRNSLISGRWSLRPTKSSGMPPWESPSLNGSKGPDESASWLADVIESWEGISIDNGDETYRLADINANPEEGCCILKLSCRNYASVSPLILGHWLADIKVTLTTDMRCYRVQMSFGSQSYHCSPRRQANKGPRGFLEVVEFSPVEHVNVFHWWHPQYPCS